MKDLLLSYLGHGEGQYYTQCPECSQYREASQRHKKCLAIKVDDEGAVCYCHNCGEKDALKWDDA